MGGGGKGGQETTSTVKLPPEIEAAAKENLRIANEVASIGYTPYQGPTVAGFSPQQMNAMRGTDQAAAFFGMPNSGTGQMPQGAAADSALTGLPPPQQAAGGFSGYSPFSLYKAAIDNLPPAQRAMIESFVIDPYTGAPPTNPTVPQPEFRYTGANAWAPPPAAPAPVAPTRPAYQEPIRGAGSER